MVSQKEVGHICLGAFAVIALMLTCTPVEMKSHDRSVRTLELSERSLASLHFDPAQSAALFVGVQRFSDTSIADVPYAVDDAIDLAYAFAIAPKVKLVNADRVVLALSGEPHKAESKERLSELRAARAVIAGATKANVLASLQKQSERVGRDGILILSFATHGFSSDGVPYVLASSSTLGNCETALTTTSILDLAATCRRSLVFFDACRDRVAAASRSIRRYTSGAPLLTSLLKSDGQVVFYAAAAGSVAYDDDRVHNGVFTANVLAGLGGKAPRDERGVITVAALQKFVEAHVLTWIRVHRDPSAGKAIQVCTDGHTDDMPIAILAPARACDPARSPARVTISRDAVTAFARSGAPLWQQSFVGITQAEAVDLDNDRCAEVVVAAGKRLSTLNDKGEVVWSVDAATPLREFRIANLFRQSSREVVALSVDATTGISHLAVYDHDGRLISDYTYSGQRIDRLRPSPTP